MDTFRIILAIGPVAIYFILLGVINLSRRAKLVSGGRDAATLALTVTGLLIVGPFELFLPRPALVTYGNYVWLMVLGFYLLSVAMGVLLLRPRLVIYNISIDKLRPVLAECVERLDGDARWAGDSLALPNLGVQLYIENFRATKNISLKSVGAIQNLHGWRRLERVLTAALSREVVSRNPRGILLFLLGLLMLGGLTALVVQDHYAIGQSLSEIVDFILQTMKL